MPMAIRESGISERDRLTELRLERAAWRRKAKVGGWFLGAGVGITVVTYLMAASNPNGGSYFVFFGPVIFGIIRLVEASKHLRRIDGEIAAIHRGSPSPWGAPVPADASASGRSASWGTPSSGTTPPPLPPPPA